MSPTVAGARGTICTAGRVCYRCVLFLRLGTRADALDGVLDFYVLLDDRAGAWPGSRLCRQRRIACFRPTLAILKAPSAEGEVGGERLRAKYAL